MISTCRRCAQLARVAKKAEHRAFWWNATAKAEPVLQKVEEHDVVIVGGGIAGLALAASLSANPVISKKHKITLLEASDLDSSRHWRLGETEYSNRVSSITNQSKALLEEIGVWQHVDQARVKGIQEMRVWDGLSDAKLEFNIHDIADTPYDPLTDPADGPAMAWLTENLNLQRALIKHLDSHQVELLSKTKVESIQAESIDQGGWPIVSLDNGRKLRARLLVGADGFNSPVRKYAGIESFGWAYDATGLVATLDLAPSIDNFTAFQRFLPTGPIAFLPLSDTKASLVWSTKPDIANALKKLDPAVLAELVNAAFRLPYHSLELITGLITAGAHIDEIISTIRWRSSHTVSPTLPSDTSFSVPPRVTSIQPKSVASFPLRFSHAISYIGQSAAGIETPNRTVLIGDAAHTMHPLAGQGLNTGLSDVKSLRDALHTAAIVGGDLGHPTSLASYPKERYSENHKMLSATDKLHKLFSREEGPIVWARSTGMEVINEWSGLKNLFMAQAGAKEGQSGLNQLWAGGVQGAAQSLATVGQASRMGLGMLRNRIAGKT